MEYNELIKEIEAGQIRPVYLFWGDEDFLLEEAVKRVTAATVKPEEVEFNIDVFYGNEIQGKQILQAAASYPFMGERRLVIVKDFQRMKPSCVELVNQHLGHPNKTTCLVLVATKLNFRLKHYKDLKNNSTIVEFKTLYDRQVPGWIKQYLKTRGFEITDEAVRLLHENTGNSLRTIVNETEKIFLNLKNRKRIEGDDIRNVVGLTRGYSIFELSNFVGNKQMDASLLTASRMLELGESPIGIVTMLARFFSHLLKVKQELKAGTNPNLIASNIGVPPFFVNDYIRQAKNYTSLQLQGAFHLLLQADVALKSSSQKPRLILELLLYQLINGNTELSV